MTNYNISIKDNKEIVFNKDPDTLEIDGCGTLEICTKFKGKKLKGWYKEQVFASFKVGYGTFYTEMDRINFDFKGQTIEMLFIIEGSFDVSISEKIFNNHFSANEHNIFYYTDITGYIEIPSGTTSIIRINLDLSFFNQFLPEESKFEDFRKQIKKNNTGKLKIENCIITPKIQLLINEMLNSKRKGFFRKIHINAVVLELLLLQLDQFNKSKQKGPLVYEEEKIIEVKNYIGKNFTQPMTLQFLSKKFGTNEFALKKGFKTLYSITVFGYIAHLKMNKARDLLIEKRLPVGEVSEIVGYKNPQHFSTAFKKKFGMTPSKFVSFN
ncbi:AraC family transcriptional regulator [Flavivirga sp. 57AJ16]|uniref:helix-turn-helix domain-containing protein n=1 Tax=Flavivirga sp. 57AJ16 TaxID=3025307 RepID=UPI0023661E0C|nr:AraC family transcriptional regulator [Flavivirga sp. 57AJ16]MDD7888133.1 AraC family transcriptional regulator [Flavivirga sp. 57AJ16]